jgi:HSP20 family protein
MSLVLRGNDVPTPLLTTGQIKRLNSLVDCVPGEDGGFLRQVWCGAPISMSEDDDHFQIEVELPGVSDQDVEVTVENPKLFIRGDRKPEEGRRYLYNGRTFGRFEHVITLPEEVRTDGVKAVMRNGVLGIELLKRSEPRPKRVRPDPG